MGLVARPLGGAICGLPSRAASVADWDHFVALARLSRSAAELLTAVLHRPVRVQLITNRVVEIDRPSTGPGSVRVVQHRLLDSRPPHGPLALSSTAVLGARLPDSIRSAARRGHHMLGELLDRIGAFWTPETLDVEQLSAADTGWVGHVPVVRLTRRLFLLGTPIAYVAEEIPLPALGRSPPAGP